MNALTMFILQLPYMFTLFALLIQRSHFLMSLLCLEGMMLSLVLLIPSFLHSNEMISSPTIAIILLTMGVCEASLGLSLLVNLSRSFGTDLFLSLTTNKC